MAGTRICPACSRPVPPAAADCPYCGERVPLALAPGRLAALFAVTASLLLSLLSALIHGPGMAASGSIAFMRKLALSQSGAFFLSVLGAFFMLRAVCGICTGAKRNVLKRIAGAILLSALFAAALCNIAACVKMLLPYA